MTRRLPLLLACPLLLLTATACSDDGKQAAAPATTATETPAPASFDAKAVAKDLGAKPQVPAPSGQPPAQLEKTDIVRGEGKTAKPGDTVAVQYVGVSWSTGRQFDASWDRGAQPFSFPLGAGRVIPGWDKGVAGMKVGGRRVLVIPPDLGYGDQSPSPDIAPGETLVFVVDLKQVA